MILAVWRMLHSDNIHHAGWIEVPIEVGSAESVKLVSVQRVGVTETCGRTVVDSQK